MIVFTDKGDGYFWAYSPSDNRQQICFKVRQLFNYNCDKYDSQSVMVCYYKAAVYIENCENLLRSATILLQSTTIIEKCHRTHLAPTRGVRFQYQLSIYLN